MSRRRLRYWFEAQLARAAFALFRGLGLDCASALGGWIARSIGPRLPVSRAAEQRLRRAMPELSAAAARPIIRAMWDNLGRVAAEYPFIGGFRLYDRISHAEVVGVEHLDRLREDGIGGIFFSGHFGNWEILSLAAGQRGLPLTLVYRAANNPAVEQLIQEARAPVPGRHFPKGATAAREMMAALKRGEHLGILVDQKQNDGIAVPFFGRPAMTAPALARLAMRYKCPVVPAKVERLGGARFRLTVYPPLALPDSGDQAADVLALMTEVNRVLEGWIRERPDHWFWLHRRWPE